MTQNTYVLTMLGCGYASLACIWALYAYYRQVSEHPDTGDFKAAAVYLGNAVFFPLMAVIAFVKYIRKAHL